MLKKMSRFERVLGRSWADFKSAIPHFRVGLAECAGPGGDYRGGCRKQVKGQSLERRRLLKGLRINDVDVR